MLSKVLPGASYLEPGIHVTRSSIRENQLISQTLREYLYAASKKVLLHLNFYMNKIVVSLKAPVNVRHP
jgi:hypothetical protein